MVKSLVSHINTEMYNTEGFVDYRKLGKLLHVPANKLALAVGVTPQTLIKSSKTVKTQETLTNILQIWTLLKSMLESNRDSLAWLRAPNKEFGNKSPLDVICSGNAQGVLDFLEDYRKGSLA